MWQAILAIASVAGVLASGQSNVTTAHRLLDLLRLSHLRLTGRIGFPSRYR